MKETKQKSWLVALGLLLTVGFLGGHRFYMGQPQLGYYIILVSISAFLVGFPALLLAVWLIADLFFVFFKIARDGNGLKLK